MSELYFDRKMSDVEGLMWRLEKDPYLTSTFGNVTILDRKPDIDRMRRRFERASIAIPRLRQRVHPSPGNVSPPTWVEDPDFSIDNHVRHIALPKPGSIRQLLDLAGLLVADPFDRTRPLWQFVLVDGIRGGKSALIHKMHHTVTDGERGVQLSLQYLDFQRDAPDPPPLEPPDTVDDESSDSNAADGLRTFIIGSLRLPLGVARQVRDLLSDPTSLPTASAAAANTFRGVVSQLADTDKARSPLWTARSLRRRIEVTRAPFRETKDAASRLGGTINTAFMTAAAHAASRYHVEMGTPTESLRASMAVSTRTESSGGNAFSVIRMLVPTAEMPIAERFAAIHEATSAAKEQSKSAGLETLAAVASALPTSVVTRLARQQTQTVDFATSNVRGAPVEMYVAGAQLLENYAIGPLAGVAFNVTMLSYLGSLDMGINIDAAAVEDPALLKRCLDRSFTELRNA
jgi:WS/DGAT/MGAT family acyltransferase